MDEMILSGAEDNIRRLSQEYEEFALNAEEFALNEIC